MIAVSSDRFNPQPKNSRAIYFVVYGVCAKKAIAAAAPPIIDMTQIIKTKIANAIQL